MTIDVRTITTDEVDEFIVAVHTGFLDHAAEGAVELRRPFIETDRAVAAVDSGRIVGTLLSFATEMTVPGGATVAADAVTMVTVTSTHRRRGLLTRMMDLDLRAAAERGDPVSVLIASEWPIYGRFGYGPATEGTIWEVDVAAVRTVRPVPGTIELVGPEVLRRQAPALFDRHRLTRPGEIAWRDRWWDEAFGLIEVPGRPMKPGFHVLGRDASGAPDGYLRYRVEGEFEHRRPRQRLLVDALVGVTPEATARLWDHCFQIDWIATVVAADRPVDEVLPWLLADGRAARQTDRHDILWLRVLDVPATLSARRYLTEGRVVLEVADPAGFAAGRFAIEGGPEGATCAPTTETAGLTVPLAALGAACLGGVGLRTLAAAGLVDEHAPGALAAADAMFRSPDAPWCSTWF